jgi:DivIVA domain-containing protein
MPLTPAEVHNVAFKKPPIGKRGYDEEEVDAFLDVVEQELARLIEENNDLRNRPDGPGGAPVDGGPELASLRDENQRLQAHIAELEQALTRGDDGAQQQVVQLQQQLTDTRRELEQAQQELADHQRGSATGSPVDEHTQAVGVLALAQQTAEQHVLHARAEAERMLTEARESAERTVTESTETSTQHLNDAEARARQLDEDSNSRATRMIEEAEHRAATITAEFEQHRVALERRIEELRTFEREYRTRLRSYLQSQLRDLDAGNGSEPTDAPTEMADAQHG